MLVVDSQVFLSNKRGLVFSFPVRISEEERARRAQVLFETHRQRQLQTYYPSTTLIDAYSINQVDCWSDISLVLRRLINLLPFGEVIPSSRFEEFVTQDLPSITDAAQEQLLYWHLAAHPTLNNHPVESLLLWSKDDYFWFITVPPREEELIETIRRGERICFLERF